MEQINPFVIQSHIQEYANNENMLFQLKKMNDASAKENLMDKIIATETRMEILIRGIEKATLSDLSEAILDCRMDGMSITAIAKHLEIARITVYKRLEEVSHSITQALTGGNEL